MSKKPPYRIKVRTRPQGRDYDVVIGLEVHTHLKADSKLFCACATDFGAAPNANVCPVCTAMPGALPVINRAAVESGIRAALALNLHVNASSTFARKNYFYPDLPKGYQISQFDQPLSSEGYLDIKLDGAALRIGIERAHLEEDAGKLVHTGSDGISGATGALVDLNRAGTPLLEIVSKPEISSPAAAVEYLRVLRERLIFAGAIAGHMEEGGLRCDANISLKPKGSPTLGVKVEIKNLNSFKFLQRALEYEIVRQRRRLDNGETVVQETRGFDPAREVTFSMRRKEESHDYRYFPDPDLLPLEIDPATIERIGAEMPELPDQKRRKYAEWGLTPEQSDLLLAELACAALFEACAAELDSGRDGFAKWFLNVFIGELHQSGRGLEDLPIDARAIASIFTMKERGEISEKSVRTVIAECLESGRDPAELVDELGLALIKDTAMIDEVVARVLAENPAQVEDYRSGSEKIFNYLVGQVMRELQGRVDFKTAGEALRGMLDR